MPRASCWFKVVLLVAVSLTSSRSYSLWCSPKLWEGRSWTLHITHTDLGPDVSEVREEWQWW